MKTEILIVGAGPVGLLLANLLGKRGVNTIIIDKKPEISTRSKAIGITPPSLKILDSLGMARDFIENGLKISDVRIHGSKSILGSVSFDHIPSQYPFVLSLPQEKTELMLLNHLKSFSSVRLIMNCELKKLENTETSLWAEGIIKNNHGDESIKISANYLCACDGYKSDVRKFTGIPLKSIKYRDSFLMGDFIDTTGWGKEAHLFFTSSGSVESFPMPGNKRRWIIQTDFYHKTPQPGYLEAEIKKRSRHELSPKDKLSQSPFNVYKHVLPRFFKGRVLFLGDAAHTISPIGGQGMNTGIADAELADALLGQMLTKGHSPSLMEVYEKCRKKAVKAAARRAWLSMRVGTVRGPFFSAVRNILLAITLKTGMGKYFSRFYAMLTIPFKGKEEVSQKFRIFFQQQ
ncbi:MAG: FAD-dependent monooxygenase [Spirochaetales bacterium]|nr:FAD-dependent monooxygenase [Spirochaetales bacterium]